MAAFKIWASGGLIPHAKHGGSGVWTLADAASKLEGTGLEYEQIGQTHVAVFGLGLPGTDCEVMDGLDDLAPGDSVAVRGR